MFSDNQVAPNELLDKYKKYEYILNIKPDRLKREMFPKAKEGETVITAKASYDEISEKLF